MTRSLMVSSSRPKASACSGVRVILGCVMNFSFALEGDVDVADWDGHTDLHVLVGRGRHRAGGQGAHDTPGFAACAGVGEGPPGAPPRGGGGRFGRLN